MYWLKLKAAEKPAVNFGLETLSTVSWMPQLWAPWPRAPASSASSAFPLSSGLGKAGLSSADQGKLAQRGVLAFPLTSQPGIPF